MLAADRAVLGQRRAQRLGIRTEDRAALLAGGVVVGNGRIVAAGRDLVRGARTESLDQVLARRRGRVQLAIDPRVLQGGMHGIGAVPAGIVAERGDPCSLGSTTSIGAKSAMVEPAAQMLRHRR